MQNRNTESDWLRADNWQAVLDDPEQLPADILNYLQSKNSITESWLGGTEARQWILDELKATIRDRDDSVEVQDGNFEYWQRFLAGAEHPDFLRRNINTQTIVVLLSGDERAEKHTYYDLGSADHSPDHVYFAITEDVKGNERYTLSVFVAGKTVPIEAPLTNCRGDFEWGSDSRKILYTRLDEYQRPSSVWCHTLGDDQENDILVFKLDDPGKFIGLGKTSSDVFITINIHDHQANQSFLLKSDLDALNPVAVTNWIDNLEYEIEHVEPYLIIRTNYNHEDFALFRSDLPAAECPTQPSDWILLWAPPAGELLSDYEVLADHWVLEISKEGCGQYLVCEADPNQFKIRYPLKLDTEIHDTHLAPLPNFYRSSIRMRLSTPALPSRTIEIDLETGAQTILKVSGPPNGHAEDNYIVKRHYGISSDGCRVPLTIVHHKNLVPTHDTPVILTGYGAYGMSLTPAFSASRRILMTRGVIHVTAHVRGGMENGYAWYRNGRMVQKDKSFDDLIGASETLIRDGFTKAGRIVLHGGSAGGLLVGATVMRRPELFRGVIADVPFVDVLSTMMDKDLPLTPPEWPEWGNPINNLNARRRLKHFSPTQMVQHIEYPFIFATAGLTDPRVTYWEPARWIDQLKRHGMGGPFLLYTELNAGHGGPSGRYSGLDDIARIYQAVVRLFDLPKDALYDL